MNPPQRIPNFSAFWPFYLSEHQHPLNRWLHFTGSTLALGLLATGVLIQHFRLIFVGFLCGYGCAWIGHFFIEGNRPASFRYPLWSFLADWKMWFCMLTGTFSAELKRVTTISIQR